MDNLDNVSKSWNQFAETDAMEAVLTGKKWEEAEFYETGRSEIAVLIKEIEELEPGLAKERALDFGCGLGRLTFGLGHYFNEVTGVDISEKMLAMAARNSRCREGISFRLNKGEKLADIPSESFDLVLSLIVLQHIPKRFAKSYLKEFIRSAKPGGLIVFQIPTRKFALKKATFWEDRPLNWDSPGFFKLCYRAIRRFIKWGPRWIRAEFIRREVGITTRALWKKLTGKPIMQMNITKKRALETLIARNGCTILHVREDSKAGDTFESHVFFVRKNA